MNSEAKSCKGTCDKPTHVTNSPWCHQPPPNEPKSGIPILATYIRFVAFRG